MAYVDAIKTLITLISTITLTPEAGGGAISKNVQAGWLNVATAKNTAGQLTPTYTVTRVSLPSHPFDANGAVDEYEDNLQVDVWCTQYGTYENAHNLREKMLAALRAVILANRKNPDASTKFFSIVNEVPRDEMGETPPIRRTIVMIKAHGFR